jgi:hypothetical protein
MCCGIFVGERLKEFDARHAADRERTIWSWHLLHHMCATNCRLKGRLLPLPWSHSADEIINIRKDLSYERTPLLTKPAEARLLRLYMVVNGIHFRQGCHFGHPQGKSRPKTSVWTFPAICTSGHSIRHVVRRWTTSPPGLPTIGRSGQPLVGWLSAMSSARSRTPGGVADGMPYAERPRGRQTRSDVRRMRMRDNLDFRCIVSSFSISNISAYKLSWSNAHVP